MISGGSVVPSANRGLKSTAEQVVEVIETESALAIDFLTFTGDVVCVLRNIGRPDLADAYERGQALDFCMSALYWHFLGDARPLLVDEEMRGFRNFYEHHRRIVIGDQVCGFIALGGERQRGTFCLELTGAGCAHVREWAQLRAKLESVGCRLTRVDVAFDDFKGRYPLSLCKKLHEEGAFTTNGRPPAFGTQGWDDDSGYTHYVGKNTGNQQLCVYEKGKQLGDKSSPWVRWEARFGSKYRDIAFDILERPGDFFLGHYPALSFIRAVADRMVTCIRRTASTFASSVRWLKHQYGALLNFLDSTADTDAQFRSRIRTLTKYKFPGWASDDPAVANSRHASAALYFAEH